MFSTVWGLFTSDEKEENDAMKQEPQAQQGPRRQPETIDLFHDTDSEDEQAKPAGMGRDASSGSPPPSQQNSSNKGNSDDLGIRVDGSMQVGAGGNKGDEKRPTEGTRYDPEEETKDEQQQQDLRNDREQPEDDKQAQAEVHQNDQEVAVEDEQQQPGPQNEREQETRRGGKGKIAELHCDNSGESNEQQQLDNSPQDQQQSEEEGEITELHGQTPGEFKEQEQSGNLPQYQGGEGDVAGNFEQSNEQGMAADHQGETGQVVTYDADYEADLEDGPVGLDDIKPDRSNDDQDSLSGQCDDNKIYEPSAIYPHPTGRLWRQRMWRMSKKKSPQASDGELSGSDSNSDEEIGSVLVDDDDNLEGADEDDFESDDDDHNLDAAESFVDQDLKSARNEMDKVGDTDLDQHRFQNSSPEVEQHLEGHPQKDRKRKRNETPVEELMEPRRKKKKKSKQKRKYIYEITTPTQTELLLHSKLNVPLADFAANSKDLSAPVESRLELSVNWKSMLIRKKRRRTRGFRHKLPLKLPISIKDIQKPVLIRYDQVEPADETAEHYGYVKRGASKMQHSLSAESKPIFDHTGPPLFSDEPILADDDYVDDRPQMAEWYPHDPFETVLNDREKELAWLFEESLHCFHNKADQYLDWKYIWEYASPGLRIELRSFEGVSAEEKYNRLIRWDVDPVSNRMKVVRRFIRGILREGYRRPHMELAIAILRMQQPCGVHTERVYPTPNFAAGNEVAHYTSEHEAALHGIRPKSERKDEDWWWQEELEAEEKQAEDSEAEEEAYKDTTTSIP